MSAAQRLDTAADSDAAREPMPGNRAPGASITAIVPAFNEERTLAEVLAALKATPGIDEILVVSDGSTDATVEIARHAEVTTFHLVRNCGKAAAMALGVSHARSPLVFFVDGDILELTATMIENIIEPVRSGRVGMQIGVRGRGRALDAFHRRFGPLLSGIRCLRREIFEAVPEDQVRGFRIETALNWACRELGLPIGTTVLHGLRHLVKERKRGALRGAWARVHMFTSVFAAFLSLKIGQPPLRVPAAGTEGLGEPEHVRF
jgi:glycosyltransferase involved in cell wall biosynthesis